MADYDINHLTKLGHLQKLAQKENQKANALAARVDALERAGAQANKIESIKVNGTAQTIASDKSVNITVPTKTSQLANDSTFQTSAQVVAAINTAISKSGHASFQKVDAVPKVDAAQENILYLVMNTTTKHYDIYAKIKGDGDSYTMELLDDTTVDLSGKVDKVAGKGLSTNDYTTAEKTKLAGIAEGANKYVHPSHTAATSGLYKITVDALGHVIAVTKVTKEDITGLGIPGTNTTYGLASTTANGLMSKEDYAKLNGMVLATDTEVDAMLTEVFGS
nr:MAG TPA: Head fiber protein [Bacteriophage sp.]